jgi:dTMP kinase
VQKGTDTGHHSLVDSDSHVVPSLVFERRVDRPCIPALRAGFVVLTDWYIYSLMARATVRGADPEWVKGVYEFALKPDIVPV